jgi:hypothetical protein
MRIAPIESEGSKEDGTAEKAVSKQPRRSSLPAIEEPQDIDQATSMPYSTFTKQQKRLICFLIAFAAMFSPLSSFIYYPAITSLAKDLHTSIELINLTISSYMIVSGIAPAIIGDLADITGRRWIYILTLFIYCAADVGLALQRSWPALLTLRMVQSVGSSGKSSVGNSVKGLVDVSKSYNFYRVRSYRRYSHPG